jgi:hypothetical protein
MAAAHSTWNIRVPLALLNDAEERDIPVGELRALLQLWHAARPTEQPPKTVHQLVGVLVA